MKSSDLRKELHQYLDNADNEALNFLQESIAAYQTKKQVEENEREELGPPLRSMTEAELIERVEQAEENFKNGKYHTHDEVLAKMKTWHAKL